jgi:hypothetical protein
LLNRSGLKPNKEHGISVKKFYGTALLPYLMDYWMEISLLPVVPMMSILDTRLHGSYLSSSLY